MMVYKDDAEAAMHLRAIEDIAAEQHVAVDDVREVYEAELSDLKSTARVDYFLPTFARRRAISALHRGRRR